MKRRIATLAVCGLGLLCSACSTNNVANSQKWEQQDQIFFSQKPKARINMAFASGDSMGMTVVARQNAAPSTMQFASVPVDGE